MKDGFSELLREQEEPEKISKEQDSFPTRRRNCVERVGFFVERSYTTSPRIRVLFSTFFLSRQREEGGCRDTTEVTVRQDLCETEKVFVTLSLVRLDTGEKTKVKVTNVTVFRRQTVLPTFQGHTVFTNLIYQKALKMYYVSVKRDAHEAV